MSCEDVSVTLNFKALLDNGLLMMLTGNDEELTPIIAIGLFNGKASTIIMKSTKGASLGACCARVL